MKALILPATLLLFLSVAAAQEIAQPTLTLNQRQHQPTYDSQSATQPVVSPPVGSQLVFYGGDYNINDPNADGFPTGNTLLVPDTTTYAAVDVPKTTNGVITGILAFVFATEYEFNPPTATYDIRVGLSEGNGGTSLASGSGPMIAIQNCIYEFEFCYYGTTVTLTVPFTVQPGTRYWFNLSPQCTISGDSHCEEQFFLLNTTQETNGVNADAQPAHQMFFNSAYFGFTWANWCDSALGLNAEQCARASFGLMGHR